MNIDVEFIGFPELRSLTRQKCVNVDFDGETFNDLVKKLDLLYKSRFRDSILNREGLVDETVQILWNSNNWVKRDNISQKLADGDKITFMRMMGGG